MNENEFELNGKVYVEIDVSDRNCDNPCAGCAFFNDNKMCFRAPSCFTMFRADSKRVIFVEKTPMTYCHNSAAAARHAHELGRLDARDEEIERIQNSLLDDMPEWAKDDGAVIDAAWRKAVEIFEERQDAI